MDTTKWDPRFLAMAKLVSTWSRDPSTKVGAVIVRPDKSVASVGFNGFPRGMADRPEWYTDRSEKYPRIVHAEINALIYSAERVSDYHLYTYPFIPCDRCCVQMAQAGIKRIVAPIPSADSVTRWGSAFDKTRQYCRETNVELVELDFQGA